MSAVIDSRRVSLFFIFFGAFFWSAGFGPAVGFLPTVAKQLGYSVATLGAIMTFMSLTSMVMTPTCGMVVDRFRVKKTLYASLVLASGVAVFLIAFVPKAPMDAVATLECDPKSSEIVLAVFENKDRRQTDNETIAAERYGDEPIKCELNGCKYTTINDITEDVKNTSEEIVTNRYDPYFCDEWMMVDGGINQISVALKSNYTEQIINKNIAFIFQLLAVQINNNHITSMACKCPTQIFCHMHCTNEAIMKKATPTIFRGNVFSLYQFWIFSALFCGFWACSKMSVTLLNPICLDILEDKPEEFGKQKCWASIGWGLFSILIGWLVDVISTNKKEKDYSPVFYFCIFSSLCTLAVSNKIKVVETRKTEVKLKNVCGLFTKHYVIAFFVWSTLNTVFQTFISNFLFWYMEDLVSANKDHSLRMWIKTIQGLAQGIQCFGGEIPFFFWSGWIIKKLGYLKCMALVPGAMAIRMFLYTVISNPIWIIAIELLNGVSYALGYSVKMSFAKIISPPDTLNTVIGFLGLFDCLGDSIASLLGGYLFDTLGGVWSFRFFAYCSAFMCSINLIIIWFELTKKDLKTSNTNEQQIITIDVKDNNIAEKQL